MNTHTVNPTTGKMMEGNNPASRLTFILSEGKKLNKGTTCRVAWCRLLNVSEEQNSLLISRIGKVMAMPEEIIKRIEIYAPSLQGTHEYWAKRVDLAFSSSRIDTKWEDFINKIDDPTISQLKQASYIIEREENNKNITENELLEIKETIEALKNKTLNSNLDGSFKRYILIYLHQIITAIEEYQISGAEPIIGTIERTLGHAFIDENYREQMKTSFGKEILDSLTTVASLLTIAVGLPQLPEAFNIYLGLLNQ